jgi:hypothetical protein
MRRHIAKAEHKRIQKHAKIEGEVCQIEHTPAKARGNQEKEGIDIRAVTKVANATRIYFAKDTGGAQYRGEGKIKN